MLTSQERAVREIQAAISPKASRRSSPQLSRAAAMPRPPHHVSLYVTSALALAASLILLLTLQHML